MGMFDEVVVKYPLPNAKVQYDIFQTKDLECLLDQYRITEEGRLLRLLVDKEIVKDENETFGFRVNISNERWIDTEHHGDLSIYTYTPDGRYCEFVFRFTEGTVTWVKELPED